MTFLNLNSLDISLERMEYTLNNIAFLSLLIMTIWHWARLIYSLQFPPAIVGTIGIASANLSLSCLLTIRWAESGHFPLSNLYESLLFLAWGFTTFHLLIEQLTKVQFVGVITAPVALLTTGFASFSLPKDMQRATALIPALQSNWLMMHVSIMMMSYVALLAGSLLAIAFLVVNFYTRQKGRRDSFHIVENGIPGLPFKFSKENLTREDDGIEMCNLQDLTALPSSISWDTTLLQSPIISRSTLGYIQKTHPSCNQITSSKDLTPLSRIQQLQTTSHSSHAGEEPKGFQMESNLIPPGALGKVTHSSISVTSRTELSSIAQTLDNLSYRTLGLGFPLLTIGILSGAVWANEAWGSYWSWDPKETWAFITWLVFAIYLHTRLTKGWKGTGPAYIAAGGFVVVWICYLGVNLLGTGLHSYGWFQKS